MIAPALPIRRDFTATAIRSLGDRDHRLAKALAADVYARWQATGRIVERTRVSVAAAFESFVETDAPPSTLITAAFRDLVVDALCTIYGVI